ncbi:MAG TPA: PKD domain-containing protein [Deltaproteobacteria bacterium]|nr:PKD domain-containing protein [Deltaproteobacteria bacterium]HQI82229.1 PKD domain-containing protein [Deltaproteobacteria bacterium]
MHVPRPITALFISLTLVLAAVGCSEDDSGSSPAPEAILEVGISSPSEDIIVRTGQSVEFHGYVEGGESPYTYQWDFDGVRPDANQKDPGVVTFNEAGTYTITFTVQDANGVELLDRVVVLADPGAFDAQPLADIVSPATNQVIRQNTALTFQGSVSGGDGPYSYRWNFHGAAPDSTAKDPGSITFSTMGSYTITFTSTDSSGRTSTDSVTIAVNSPTGTYWTAVAAGGYHSAALRSDGTLWAWGDNTYGQVGINTTTDCLVPQRVGGGADWTAVALGTYHTLGLRKNGTLWAWGANHRGQLGTGDTSSSYTPHQVGTASDWAGVSAGTLHTVALKKDGTLWAWGANTYGQLGTGDRDDRLTPVQIGQGNIWVEVTSGEEHSLALKSDRSLWAWGNNSNGQLGTGDTVIYDLPFQSVIDNDWAYVAAGFGSTVAVKTNGTLWDWLGVPIRVGTRNDWAGPIDSGMVHSVVIARDGSLWTWGNNSFGQLGTGTHDDSTLPVQVGSDRNWSGVAAGYHHTLGLRSDGTIWAWGRNDSGQLGNGTLEDSSVPVRTQ